MEDRTRACGSLATAVGVGVLVCSIGAARADGAHELTFDDAIALALAHNGELYLAQANVAMAADDVALAESVFVPRFIATARGGHEVGLGSPARLNWTDTLVTGSLELTGLMSSGATYSLGYNATSDRFSSPFLTIYNPAFTTGLTLSLTQPLLRNAGRGAMRQPIVVASLRRDSSEQELRVHLEDILGEVEIAYWSLALAHNEVQAHEATLKLAKDQLVESQRLVRLGSISDLDVTEAQAGIGRIQQELLLARQHTAEAEGALRKLIVGDPSWNPGDELIPIDKTDTEPVSLKIEEHLELARKNRPDVLAARSGLETEQAALGVTANALKPQLDLILSGGVVGFAGELDTTSGVLTTLPGFVPNPSANGGVARAFTNLVSDGDYTVSVGLRLELPLVNSAASARNEHQRHAVTRARIAQQALLAQVETEVRTSIALLQTEEQLEKVADDAVTTNERLLAGMRKRFAAGAVTSYDVLRVAEALTRAQIDAARARVSYRLSLARLARVDGTLLARHKVSVSSLQHVK